MGMLRLDSTIEQRPYSIEVGDYSPLQIEFEPRIISIDESYYWRSTNNNYLLEIKLHASDGAIAEINIVLVQKERIVRSKSIQEFFDVETESMGLPLFQTLPWSERIGKKEIGINPALRRYDNNIPFQFHIANDGVAFLFDGCIPQSSVKNGNINFLFNSSNNMCGIRINDKKIGAAAVRLYGNI